jgi:hypothetical protein
LNDLYQWFSQQHHGLGIFQLFRQKLADFSEGEPEQKALNALLSQLGGRYIEAFDEEPLPATVADRAYERLLKLVASFDPCASADGRLADLNRVPRWIL